MKKLLALALTSLVVLSLAACVAPSTQQAAPPAATQSQPSAAEAQPTTAAVQPATGGKVTVRLMDQFTGDVSNAGMENLVKMFMEKNPNIEIKRDPITSDNMRTMVQTSLASGEGPDIIYYDTGPGFAGVLARAGLLLPLDEAYKQYKWDERIFPWTKARTTFDGKVYGIGNELEFLGGFYNKDLFKKLGLSEPKTYDDLLTICQKAKDAGYVPITFGDSEKWPAYHMFSMTTNNLIGKSGLDDILFGNGRWDSPDIVRAIQLFFVDMNKGGCFIPDTTGTNYADANTVFYSGKGLVDLTGTWLTGDIQANVKDFEVGWFFFPAIDNKPILPPAGLGSGYFVSAKTQHPQEAMQFLDFLFSDEAAKVWLEQMSMVPPIKLDTGKYTLSPLVKFEIDALQTQEMGYNIDVLTPDTFNTMMGDGFQSVLLGEKTAEQQAKDLEKVWEEAKAAGKILK